MPLNLAKRWECCGMGGADPLVRAGRPRPAFGTTVSVPCGAQEADGGVGRGPGGPPHNLCRCSGVATLSVPSRKTVQSTLRGSPHQPAWRDGGCCVETRLDTGCGCDAVSN